jgi:hypothetical protein
LSFESQPLLVDERKRNLIVLSDVFCRWRLIEDDVVPIEEELAKENDFCVALLSVKDWDVAGSDVSKVVSVN